MSQAESAGTAGISNSQQQSLPSASPQGSFSMEAHDPPQSLPTQGKPATIHDFLSLCGAGASSTSSTSMPNHGSQQSSTTHDFLQPLQKSLIPSGSSNNLLPNGFAYTLSKPYIGNNELAIGGQQSCYAFGNGSFDPRDNFQTKYRSTNISFGGKSHGASALPLNKHWQQQPGAEFLDGTKRLSRVPSEEDDDEDEESFEHIYSAKKDGCYPKGENAHQLDGRNQDNKAITPRSKHSATEQRRRSKINDRFQMLRQLLPNADQKRDKASFLLEVIEYIQMLHDKVKKYEASELRGQHQERTKVLSWDRCAGQLDATYGSMHEIKEGLDPNGYVRKRLSPLRVMSEDGITAPELVCTMVPPPAMQAVSNYDGKPQISKPIHLSFSQAPSSEQMSTSMHQNLMPEGQTVFGQLLRPEEQASAKSRVSLSNKTEAVPPAHIQQVRNMLVAQDVHQVSEQIFSGSKAVDQILLNANFRGTEEAEGLIRSGLDTTSASGKDVNRPHFGLDGRGAFSVSDGSRLEQRSEVSTANEQERPTILGGVINISSVYSQGLLDTLTRALQSSGVDLAQATISVQIDLGKPEALSSKQMVPLSTGLLPPQTKQLVPSLELEPARKKLKVEAD